MSEKIYDLKSKMGTNLEVYEDKVILTCKGVASFLNGTAQYGEKTILYSDCVAIQFRKAIHIVANTLCSPFIERQHLTHLSFLKN